MPECTHGAVRFGYVKGKHRVHIRIHIVIYYLIYLSIAKGLWVHTGIFFHFRRQNLKICSSFLVRFKLTDPRIADQKENMKNGVLQFAVQTCKSISSGTANLTGALSFNILIKQSSAVYGNSLSCASTILGSILCSSCDLVKVSQTLGLY